MSVVSNNEQMTRIEIARDRDVKRNAHINAARARMAARDSRISAGTQSDLYIVVDGVVEFK